MWNRKNLSRDVACRTQALTAISLAGRAGRLSTSTDRQADRQTDRQIGLMWNKWLHRMLQKTVLLFLDQLLSRKIIAGTGARLAGPALVGKKKERDWGR